MSTITINGPSANELFFISQLNGWRRVFFNQGSIAVLEAMTEEELLSNFKIDFEDVDRIVYEGTLLHIALIAGKQDVITFLLTHCGSIIKQYDHLRNRPIEYIHGDAKRTENELNFKIKLLFGDQIRYKSKAYFKEIYALFANDEQVLCHFFYNYLIVPDSRLDHSTIEAFDPQLYIQFVMRTFYGGERVGNYYDMFSNCITVRFPFESEPKNIAIELSLHEVLPLFLHCFAIASDEKLNGLCELFLFVLSSYSGLTYEERQVTLQVISKLSIERQLCFVDELIAEDLFSVVEGSYDKNELQKIILMLSIFTNLGAPIPIKSLDWITDKLYGIIVLCEWSKYDEGIKEEMRYETSTMFASVCHCIENTETVLVWPNKYWDSIFESILYEIKSNKTVRFLFWPLVFKVGWKITLIDTLKGTQLYDQVIEKYVIRIQRWWIRVCHDPYRVRKATGTTVVESFAEDFAKLIEGH